MPDTKVFSPWPNIGDEDPTNEIEDDQSTCGSVTSTGGYSLFCTRGYDHPAPHLATDGSMVLDVWWP